MSLTDTLTLDDASGDATEFVLISRDGSGTVRRNSASTNAEPWTLVVNHKQTGSGLDIVDRHLIQAARLVRDTQGKARTAIVNVTLAVPQHEDVTDGMIMDMFANITDLLTDGGFGDSGMTGTTNLTKVLRGES